jgi:putative nucleotidyltransferase with HDIG domain
LTAPTARDVVAKISEIGSLPQTLSAVLKVLNNSRAGVDEIADVISKDISLTSRVLKMVNSVQFSRRRKVVKISEAIVVLGLNSVKVLTLSSSIFGLAADKESFKKFNIKRIWRHLIEVAASARNLSAEIGFRDPEEAFISGILHDIGIVLLLLYSPEKYYEVIEKVRTEPTGILEIEKDILGTTHTEVGAEIINLWKLPPQLAYVTANHHAYERENNIGEEMTLCDIVALADRLSLGPYDDCYPNIEENFVAIHKICGRLGVSSEIVNRIRKRSILESIQLAEYLELDVGDLIEILAEANDKLAELYYSLERIYLEKIRLQEILNNSKKSVSV